MGEVIEDKSAKLQRLQELLELYAPSQDGQMVIIAHSVNLPAVLELVGHSCEAADFEYLDTFTSKEGWKAAVEGFEAGNTFILAMSTEVCTRRESDLGKPTTVLINFDFPDTLQLLLYRIFKRADSNTCVHDFFSPSADTKLSVPLLKFLDEGGMDVPAGLYECWSRHDHASDS